MRFVLVHKVCSYLMVATSLLALVTSGQLHPLVSLIAAAGLLGSWWWEPPRIDPARFELVWNIATLGMLAKTAFDVLTGGPLIIGGVYFIVFLATNKLFNRRASRDYLQLYVLSFLQIVAATTLNTDLMYGVLFLAYIVFTTWTLILFHLKREMEENYLLKYGDSLQGRPVQVQRVLNSRKLVGGRFLLATSGVSLAVFIGAAALFFLFPRVGFGFFFSQRRAGITMTGFSDTVELGHFGRIKDDPTVVMRVEFDGGKPDDRIQPRYWRGIALDHYDGTTWTKTAGGTAYVSTTGGRIPLNQRRLELADDAVRQRIYLEPMDAHVLFGLSRITHIEMEPRKGPRYLAKPRGVRIDVQGDIQYAQQDELAFRYTAFSERETNLAPLLRATIPAYRKRLRGYIVAHRGRFPYLQLPAGLDPRVAALAREVVGDAKTIGQAVERVERHLRRNYAYTLDLKRDVRFAPLEDFLFVQRRGHCEYFATAMVILLRSVGIAARNVNGFLGGKWNDFGKYLSVSQGEAHSWVEVYVGPDDAFPAGVWATRDPTPAGTGRATSSSVLWDRMLQYTDALRLRWYKYVIEYDLQKQVGAFVSLRTWWREHFDSTGATATGEKAKSEPLTRGVVLTIVVLVVVFVGVPLLLRRRTGVGTEARARRHSTAVANLYQQLLDAYAHLGFVRTQATTASEFLRQLERRRAPDLDLARTVVAMYESVRFGGGVLEAAGVAPLRARIKRLGR